MKELDRVAHVEGAIVAPQPSTSNGSGERAEPIIAIDRVSKTYESGGGTVTALQDVSLTIAPGEFISLSGPSGCGKSTLMRLVGDLTQPTAGTLKVKGKTPQQARIDRDYGIVFQAPVLYEWRTVRKNVELPLEVMGHPADQRRERVQAMLALVGLSDFGVRGASSVWRSGQNSVFCLCYFTVVVP